MIFPQFLGGCCYCQLRHSADLPCASLCAHCKALHMLEDLVDGQCPRMAGFAQEVYHQVVPCKNCPAPNGPLQLKKIALSETSEEKSKGPECNECLGAGVLPLLMECCAEGCDDCGYLGLKPNPAAKRAHMLPTTCKSEKKQCVICLERMREGENLFQMQCGHEFHFLCMAECLLSHKRCPCCRHTDMFLLIDAEFMQRYRTLRGEPVLPVVSAHIDFNGEIVEGFEDDGSEEWEQYSEGGLESENGVVEQEDNAPEAALLQTDPFQVDGRASGPITVFEVQQVEAMLKQMMIMGPNGHYRMYEQQSEQSSDDFGADQNGFDFDDSLEYE